MERTEVAKKLDITGGVLTPTEAAKELGLSRVGLRSKLERYGLEKVEQIYDEETMGKRVAND